MNINYWLIVGQMVNIADICVHIFGDQFIVYNPVHMGFYRDNPVLCLYVSVWVYHLNAIENYVHHWNTNDVCGGNCETQL